MTDNDAAFEIDAYVGLELNANFTVSLLGAFADPEGRAAVDRPHRELRLRHGVRRVQLLREAPHSDRGGSAPLGGISNSAALTRGRP